MFSVKITKIGESNSNLGNFPCHTTGPQHLSSVPFPSCSEHASWDVSSTPTASTATSVPLTSQFLSPAYTCALRSTSIHSAPYWTSLQKCRETGNSYSVCSKFSSSPKPASLSSRLWNYYALSHPNHHIFSSPFSPHPVGFKPLLMLHTDTSQVSPFLPTPLPQSWTPLVQNSELASSLISLSPVLTFSHLLQYLCSMPAHWMVPQSWIMKSRFLSLALGLSVILLLPPASLMTCCYPSCNPPH